MTSPWEAAAETAIRFAAEKTIREGSVRPKNFMGGPDADYRVVLGKALTFLTEHVPSGKKVPAVEAGQVAKGVSQVLNNRAGGVLCILGGVAAVAAVYGAYEARKGRKETQAVRVELGQMRVEPHTKLVEAHEDASELAATSNAVEEVIARSGDNADRTPAELPILTRTADLLLPPRSGGLDLNEPLPVRTALHLELVERLKGRASGSAASVPRTPQPLAALGHPLLQELVGEVDEDLLRAVLLDPDAGLGEMRRDYDIDTPAPRSYENGREIVLLDWPEVAKTEVNRAWEENESGATGGGIQRLALLMRFLDGILGEEGSSLYPEITLAPLLALSEFSLKLHREREGDENTLDRAREWISALAGHAQSVGDEYHSFQAHLLELRLDAWTDPSADLASRLRALQEREGVGDELADVVTTLRDIATATGNVDVALATAKALIPRRPDPDHEDSWYWARIGLARLTAQGGDRKGAQGIATRIQHVLESRADALWLEEVVEGASELAEELRAGGRQMSDRR